MIALVFTILFSLLFVAPFSSLASRSQQDGGQDLIQTIGVEVKSDSILLSSSESSFPGLINAKSALLVDAATGEILYAKDSALQSPIASITKLMTAIVVVESDPDWHKGMVLERQDERLGGHVYINRGERVTVKDLLYTSLIGSDNTATMTLARSTGLSAEEFVERMNSAAIRLGLIDTHFVEPTGLDSGNISTTLDLARLVRYALEQSIIQKAVSSKSYIFTTLDKKRTHIVNSTNKLLTDYAQDFEVLGGKTGYIYESGYNLVTKGEKNGRSVISIVLGTGFYETRFTESNRLISWALNQ